MDPAKLRYSKTHEWAYQEGEIVTVGISQFAADLLNDITYIKLPEVGKNLVENEAFGEIETVKAVSDLYAPVAGKVVAVNEAIVRQPEKLKADPFGEGWLIKVSAEGGMDHLLSPADYQKQIESEPH
jgi:glycine cleavage system H protein